MVSVLFERKITIFILQAKSVVLFAPEGNGRKWSATSNQGHQKSVSPHLLNVEHLF